MALDDDSVVQASYPSAKPTSEEYAIAKHLRFKVPVHQGKLQGIDVKCFFAEDAVNALLDSKWATGPGCMFTDRQSCVDFCHRLLCFELFHRAKLVKKPEVGARPSISAIRKRMSEKGKEDDGGDAGGDAGKKKKKKLKLDMHNSQRFVDGQEVFVWIYDPTPAKHFIIGFLLVFGTIAFVLFPLWPPGLRRAAYYCSWVGIALLSVLLGLGTLRYVIFLGLWVITRGRQHFWLLPNLLKDDCGMLESFSPLYTHRLVEPGEAAAVSAEGATAQAVDDEADGTASGDHDSTANEEEEKKGGEVEAIDDEERARRRRERELARTEKRAELAARRAELAKKRHGVSKKERRRRRDFDDDDDEEDEEEDAINTPDSADGEPSDGGTAAASRRGRKPDANRLESDGSDDDVDVGQAEEDKQEVPLTAKREQRETSGKAAAAADSTDGGEARPDEDAGDKDDEEVYQSRARSKRDANKKADKRQSSGRGKSRRE